MLSTGDIKDPYEIVEIVMTLQAAEVWDQCWAKVLRGLRSDALKLGCDAVVNIQFEHRTFLKVDQKTGVEFFAAGTAVRRR